MERICDGRDPEELNLALGELIGRHDALAASAIALILPYESADFDDALQSTYIKLHLRLPRLRDPARFRSWYRTIALHEALNVCRSQQGRRTWMPLDEDVELDPGWLPAGPEEEVARGEAEQRLWLAVAALPRQQQRAITLYHRDGCKYEEISRLMGIAIGTVGKTLSDARKNLEPLLREEGPQPLMS
jgi:RNA polymerase sigma factor (sigma-70 family)